MGFRITQLQKELILNKILVHILYGIALPLIY